MKKMVLYDIEMMLSRVIILFAVFGFSWSFTLLQRPVDNNDANPYSRFTSHMGTQAREDNARGYRELLNLFYLSQVIVAYRQPAVPPTKLDELVGELLEPHFQQHLRFLLKDVDGFEEMKTFGSENPKAGQNLRRKAYFVNDQRQLIPVLQAILGAIHLDEIVDDEFRSKLAHLREDASALAVDTVRDRMALVEALTENSLSSEEPWTIFDIFENIFEKQEEQSFEELYDVVSEEDDGRLNSGGANEFWVVIDDSDENTSQEEVAWENVEQPDTFNEEVENELKPIHGIDRFDSFDNSKEPPRVKLPVYQPPFAARPPSFAAPWENKLEQNAHSETPVSHFVPQPESSEEVVEVVNYALPEEPTEPPTNEVPPEQPDVSSGEVEELVDNELNPDEEDDRYDSFEDAKQPPKVDVPIHRPPFVAGAPMRPISATSWGNQLEQNAHSEISGQWSAFQPPFISRPLVPHFVPQPENFVPGQNYYEHQQVTTSPKSEEVEQPAVSSEEAEELVDNDLKPVEEDDIYDSSEDTKQPSKVDLPIHRPPFAPGPPKRPLTAATWGNEVEQNAHFEVPVFRPPSILRPLMPHFIPQSENFAPSPNYYGHQQVTTPPASEEVVEPPRIEVPSVMSVEQPDFSSEEVEELIDNELRPVVEDDRYDSFEDVKQPPKVNAPIHRPPFAPVPPKRPISAVSWGNEVKQNAHSKVPVFRPPFIPRPLVPHFVPQPESSPGPNYNGHQLVYETNPPTPQHVVEVVNYALPVEPIHPSRFEVPVEGLVENEMKPIDDRYDSSEGWEQPPRVDLPVYQPPFAPPMRPTVAAPWENKSEQNQRPVFRPPFIPRPAVPHFVPQPQSSASGPNYYGHHQYQLVYEHTPPAPEQVVEVVNYALPGEPVEPPRIEVPVLRPPYKATPPPPPPFVENSTVTQKQETTTAAPYKLVQVVTEANVEVPSSTLPAYVYHIASLLDKKQVTNSTEQIIAVSPTKLGTLVPAVVNATSTTKTSVQEQPYITVIPALYNEVSVATANSSVNVSIVTVPENDTYAQVGSAVTEVTVYVTVKPELVTSVPVVPVQNVTWNVSKLEEQNKYWSSSTTESPVTIVQNVSPVDVVKSLTMSPVQSVYVTENINIINQNSTVTVTNTAQNVSNLEEQNQYWSNSATESPVTITTHRTSTVDVIEAVTLSPVQSIHATENSAVTQGAVNVSVVAPTFPESTVNATTVTNVTKTSDSSEYQMINQEIVTATPTSSPSSTSTYLEATTVVAPTVPESTANVTTVINVSNLPESTVNVTAVTTVTKTADSADYQITNQETVTAIPTSNPSSTSIYLEATTVVVPTIPEFTVNVTSVTNVTKTPDSSEYQVEPATVVTNRQTVTEPPTTVLTTDTPNSVTTSTEIFKAPNFNPTVIVSVNSTSATANETLKVVAIPEEDEKTDYVFVENQKGNVFPVEISTIQNPEVLKPDPTIKEPHYNGFRPTPIEKDSTSLTSRIDSQLTPEKEDTDVLFWSRPESERYKNTDRLFEVKKIADALEQSVMSLNKSDSQTEQKNSGTAVLDNGVEITNKNSFTDSTDPLEEENLVEDLIWDPTFLINQPESMFELQTFVNPAESHQPEENSPLKQPKEPEEPVKNESGIESTNLIDDGGYPPYYNKSDVVFESEKLPHPIDVSQPADLIEPDEVKSSIMAPTALTSLSSIKEASSSANQDAVKPLPVDEDHAQIAVEGSKPELDKDSIPLWLQEDNMVEEFEPYSAQSEDLATTIVETQPASIETTINKTNSVHPKPSAHGESLDQAEITLLRIKNEMLQVIGFVEEKTGLHLSNHISQQELDDLVDRLSHTELLEMVQEHGVNRVAVITRLQQFLLSKHSVEGDTIVHILESLKQGEKLEPDDGYFEAHYSVEPVAEDVPTNTPEVVGELTDALEKEFSEDTELLTSVTTPSTNVSLEETSNDNDATTELTKLQPDSPTNPTDTETQLDSDKARAATSSLDSDQTFLDESSVEAQSLELDSVSTEQSPLTNDSDVNSS
ncbi:uncharacterized protein LOC129724555 [Wyeomyia smithii]|uniref:uncharacterized protein LOC129724555 n=1 Tax=Wyeomyia smithii TaxID=174621 RepID=UPI0024680797|nr:uncharacterized protein LOC129724555 [Wyeomyia smithii]